MSIVSITLPLSRTLGINLSRNLYRKLIYSSREGVAYNAQNPPLSASNRVPLLSLTLLLFIWPPVTIEAADLAMVIVDVIIYLRCIVAAHLLTLSR